MGAVRPTDVRTPVPVRVLRGLLLLAVFCFAVSTVPGVRGQDGFDVALDGCLQGTGYVLCAVVAVLQAVSARSRRLFWRLLAGSVTLRALGFVLFLTVVRTSSPAAYPSVADASWIASGLVLVAAVAARLRLRSASLLLVLDALIGALTAAGLAVVLLYDTLVDLTRAGTPAGAVATNLAYPVIDVAVLVVTVGLLASTAWRPRRGDLVLVAGLVCFAVVDAVFLYQAAAGLYRPGTYLAALSLGGTAAIVASGWTASPADRATDPAGRRGSGVVVPVVFSVLCVVALVVASYAGSSGGAVVLLVLALAVTIARGVLTLVADSRHADRVIAAKQEELLRFRALVEASHDFIAIAGLEGEVLYVNPAGRRLVGLEADADVLRTTIQDYLTEEGVRASLEVEQPAVVEHGYWEGESTLRDLRGGPPIPVAINSFLMHHPETGEPLALATVQRDVSERLRAERELREVAESRRVLLARLVQAQEDERARIAADVHDDSVQALAVVQLRLALLGRQLDHVTTEEQRRSLLELQQAVEGATGRLRALLFDLDSPALRADLATAVEEAASHVFEDTAIAWRLSGDRSVDLPEAPRVTAYRVIQEALVNVRRHAHAEQVVILLTRHQPGWVSVSVTDDGCGLQERDLQPSLGHFGVASMRDRAAVAGGRLEIAGLPTGGTRVRLWLPEVP